MRKSTLLISYLLSSIALVFFLHRRAEALQCEPEPTHMAIQHGDQIDCRIDPADDSDEFQFSGNTGDSVSIEVVAKPNQDPDFTPRLRLYAPDGTLLHPVPNQADIRQVDAQLLQTGTYTVRVYEIGGFAGNQLLPGDYAFTVTCLGGSCLPFPPPPPQEPPGRVRPCKTEPTEMFVQHGEQIDCRIDPAGDSDVFHFSGNTGDKVFIEVVAKPNQDSDFDPKLRLYAPDGTLLHPVPNQADIRQVDAQLLQTGTYTVRVYEIGGFAGNQLLPGDYAFTVTCLGGSCLPLLPFEDIDGDGEVNATDLCPSTPPGAEVDQNGCSQEEFCTAIDATTALGGQRCKKADWQNDEPLMKAKEADCVVDRGGSGLANDLCVSR